MSITKGLRWGLRHLATGLVDVQLARDINVSHKQLGGVILSEPGYTH
jgi:hypothetical protein